MSPKLSSLSAVLALVASSCASSPQYGEPLALFKCNTLDGNWVLMEPPEDADAYRLLASERSPHQSYSIADQEWGRYSDETWLMSDQGQIILCLTEGPPAEAWGSNWWKFEIAEDQHRLVDLGATITVG